MCVSVCVCVCVRVCVSVYVHVCTYMFHNHLGNGKVVVESCKVQRVVSVVLLRIEKVSMITEKQLKGPTKYNGGGGGGKWAAVNEQWPYTTT